MKRSALGKGHRGADPGGAAAPPRPVSSELPVSEIRPNPLQPRRHFAADSLRSWLRRSAGTACCNRSWCTGRRPAATT